MIRPLSVIYGKDKDVIPLLVDIHAKQNCSILDCTYNKGVMWKGLNFKPVRMDINPELDLDVVGDFKKMPFDDSSFDVIVFDPPYLPTAAASKNSSQIYHDRYGITANDELRSGDNISPLFEPFLIEAKRVLTKNGVILAKLMDVVHNHMMHWLHLDFIVAAQKAGLTACDMVIKVDPSAGKLTSSKWRTVKHFRRSHAYWIVIRKGRCERPNVAG